MRYAIVLAALAACGSTKSAPAKPIPPEKPAVDKAVTEEPPPAPLVAGTLEWTDEGGASIAIPEGGAFQVLVDGDRLVWTGTDGGVRSAPLAGGPATLLAQEETQVGAIAAADGRIYIAGSHALSWVPRSGGTPEQIATLQHGRALLLAGEILYVADDDQILGVARAGGKPQELAENVGNVQAMATDGVHLYWADHGKNEQRWGSIQRVPIAGGTVEKVAKAQFYPVGLALRDEHVYWSNGDGEAIMRAPKAGGAVEIVLYGRGNALAMDDETVVVRTVPGLLLEQPLSGGTPIVRDTRGASWSLALTPDAIYSTTELEIHRYPRDRSSLTLLAAPRGRVADLTLAGKYLYYLDVHVDLERDDRVMRVPVTGGTPEVVVSFPGDPLHLAVAGNQVVIAQSDELLLGDKPIAQEGILPQAVAVDDKNVYWVDGSDVFSVPLTGGEPRQIYTPAGTGYGGGGIPPATIVVSRGVVYAAGALLPGLIRIDKKKKAQELVRDATDFALAGKKVVAVVPERGLVVYPGKKVLLAESKGNVTALAADKKHVWAILETATPVSEEQGAEDEGAEGGASNLVRIPLAGGDPVVILRGVPGAKLAVDDKAVYLGVREKDAVLRLQK